MEVMINEVVSTIRSVDGAALLDPRTMAQIVRAVMAAVEAASAQDKRRQADSNTGKPASDRSE